MYYNKGDGWRIRGGGVGGGEEGGAVVRPRVQSYSHNFKQDPNKIYSW